MRILAHEKQRQTLLQALPDAPWASLRTEGRLYAVSSLSRRIGDYDTSLEYLQRFEREIPEHALKDDVLVELGYHMLVVQNDWPAAKKHFDAVITQYPDRNAYDNALWWMARGLKRQGEYAGAIGAYAEITAAAVAGRFRQWSDGEARRLAFFKQFAPFQGVALRSGGVDEASGLYVVQVEAQSPLAKFLVRDDRLVAVCDQYVQSIDKVLDAVVARQRDDQCKILYLRASELLRITGSGGTGWSLSKMALNDDQLDQLALDTKPF